MDKQELKDRLDVVSRAGAIVLIALYGAGFIVVSFHNAQYGIVEFGLFRTKLLSAGIIFALFVGLPFLEASGIFGLFGFHRVEFATLTRSQKLFAFFGTAWGSIFLLRFTIGDFDFSWRVVLVYMGFPAIYSAVLVSKGFRVLAKNIAFVMTVILCIASVVALILVRQWGPLGLLAWFMLVGWLTYQIDTPMRNLGKLIEVNWISVFINVVTVFGLFAIFLYPRIEPMLGGGRPSRVVLQFASISPVDNSTKMDVWLVDETDGGYYFMRAPEDHGAIFVPKSLVSAVYFRSDKSMQ